MLEKVTSNPPVKKQKRIVDLLEEVKKEMVSIEQSVLEKVLEEVRKELTDENARLRRELRQSQSQLARLEVHVGPSHCPRLCASFHASESDDDMLSVSSYERDNYMWSQPVAYREKPEEKPVEKEVVKKKEKTNETQKKEKREVNVGRLDLRVGRIVSVEKHPDADTLYIEKIYFGEQQPRTVVSHLVKFVPIEQMRDRMVVVLCNLKPVMIRGVLSEGMIMCASAHGRVEVLVPPNDSFPGDRVTCDLFPGTPDGVLNPKKKIFKQVAPDLKTDDECVATYKGLPLAVSGKGVVRSETLIGAPIK